MQVILLTSARSVIERTTLVDNITATRRPSEAAICVTSGSFVVSVATLRVAGGRIPGRIADV